DEAALVADLAAHRDREALRLEAGEILVEALGPISDMLGALVAVFAELAVHRRHVVARLYELDLQRARVGEGDRVVGLIALAAVPVVPDRHLGVVVPGTYPEHAAPV